GERAAESASKKSRAFAAELQTISSPSCCGLTSAVEGASTSSASSSTCGSDDGDGSSIELSSALAMNDPANGGSLISQSGGEDGSARFAPIVSSSVSTWLCVVLCGSTGRGVSLAAEATDVSWLVCCMCHADASLLCML